MASMPGNPIENIGRIDYEAQVWEDGVSPVNAERMNHMEEGIKNAGIYVVDLEFDENYDRYVDAGTHAKVQQLLLNGGMAIAREINGSECKFYMCAGMYNDEAIFFSAISEDLGLPYGIVITPDDLVQTA